MDAVQTGKPWHATWTSGNRCEIRSSALGEAGVVIATIHTGTSDADADKTTAAANAAFICTATNAFVELVTACKAAQAALRATSAKAKDYSYELTTIKFALEQARLCTETK